MGTKRSGKKNYNAERGQNQQEEGKKGKKVAVSRRAEAHPPNHRQAQPDTPPFRLSASIPPLVCLCVAHATRQHKKKEKLETLRLTHTTTNSTKNTHTNNTPNLSSSPLPTSPQHIPHDDNLRKKEKEKEKRRVVGKGHPSNKIILSYSGVLRIIISLIKYDFQHDNENETQSKQVGVANTLTRYFFHVSFLRISMMRRQGNAVP